MDKFSQLAYKLTLKDGLVIKIANGIVRAILTQLTRIPTF